MVRERRDKFSCTPRFKIVICETTIARENFPRSPVPSGIIWSRIREMKIRSIIRRKIFGISIVTID